MGLKELGEMEFMTPDEFDKFYESDYFSALARDIRPGDLVRAWPDKDGKVIYKFGMQGNIYLGVRDSRDNQEKEVTYKEDALVTVKKPEPELKLVQ